MRVAVVGATGAVGREMVRILEEKNIPISELYLYASPRSEGTEMEFKGEKIKVEVLNEKKIKKVDFALFSAGSKISEIFAPKFASYGIVIDNSSRWRLDDDVPLIVPEVNPHRVKDIKKGIIANPNCSTIQMVVALNPLHKKFGIENVTVATYQSTSGMGKKGMDELMTQTLSYLDFKDDEPKVFPKKIAFNVIPRIGKVYETGDTEEEMKMVKETKKIMEADIKVSAICVRVPVFIGHSEAVFVKLKKDFSPKEVIETLKEGEGLEVMTRAEDDEYPTPLEIAGSDKVYVGRIKKTENNLLAMWIVADNLRKGAALNAVQILELLIKEKNKN